ncbi:MAG: hypothetical protein V3W44_05840 [Dehalococcoidales bacterium]
MSVTVMIYPTKRLWQCWRAVAGISLATACVVKDSPPPNPTAGSLVLDLPEKRPGPVVPVPPIPDKPVAANDATDRVSPRLVEGVWVFFHSDLLTNSDGGTHLARFDGIVRIVDKCLYLNDMIVVWHTSREYVIADAIRATRGGRLATLAGAGSGISPQEGAASGDFPRSVVQRCSTSRLWFSSWSGHE